MAMPAMDEAFWANLDAHIVAQRPDGQDKPPAPVQAAPVPAVAGEASPAPRRVASDWTGVLDTLTAAKSAAQQQEARLREQAAEQDALIQELKRSQQEVRAYEQLLREVQAQADAKANELRARAEAQIGKVQAEAAAKLQAMEARAQAAERRAEAAEGWLVRIEQASRDLVPGERRAAA
jgi:septal ring factor EnvC (AmiA/AmiB activator)